MNEIYVSKEQSRKIQELELQALIEVDRICRKHGINYTLEKIRERNGQLRAPCSMPEKRKEILELYAERDYKKIVAYWKKDSRKNRMVEKLKRRIPNKLKRIIKRMVN